MGDDTVLRIALAQINPHVGDVDGNTDMVLRAWEAAADAGADLVAFPELAITGYPPEDLLFKPEFVAANEAAVSRLAAEGPSGTVAVVGCVHVEPTEDGDDEWDVAVAALSDLRNGAAVIADGEIVGYYDKARLPNYGVFDEGRYFTPDDEPLVVNVAGVPVGITVCEDLWSTTGPISEAARHGARFIVNVNASPFQRRKRDDREHWIRHHAEQDGVGIAYVNSVGGQDELVFDGDSAIYGEDGEALARAAQFETDLLVTDVSIDAEPLRGARDLPGHRGDRPDLPEHEDRPRLDDTGEVWAAVVLGTRDYARKNGFERLVLGLSGGIDSSVTAAVTAAAVGGDNVVGVSMPSPYSSEHSVTDARELAASLGLHYESIAIEPGMKAFDEMLAGLFEGTEPGVAEENVQARLRGMLLMAISNKFGHLVIASSNKSEASVGYSTLYGDMAGGFAPLKDCDKQLVYELARYRNSLDDGPVIPQNVITKPPSAELRPGQEDEDELLPYHVLDEILHHRIEGDLSVEDLVAKGFDEDDVREVIRMVDRAEFKRRQAPPGVKISRRAFGKDRRVPITNGWTS